jgi:hypothetical protein
MLLLVKNSLENREVTSSHGRQRRVPRVWIHPVQEKWPYPGIVKLLGMILSPGNSRHFPDAISADPTLTPPAPSP